MSILFYNSDPEKSPFRSWGTIRFPLRSNCSEGTGLGDWSSPNTFHSDGVSTAVSIDIPFAVSMLFLFGSDHHIPLIFYSMNKPRNILWKYIHWMLWIEEIIGDGHWRQIVCGHSGESIVRCFHFQCIAHRRWSLSTEYQFGPNIMTIVCRHR